MEIIINGIKQGRTKQYDKDELINVILDDELLSGSKIRSNIQYYSNQ